MVIEGAIGIIGVGSAGGVLAEVLHWWGLRQAEKLPKYLTRPLYWIVTVMMVVASGFLSWVYFGERAEAILALHVGVSTPFILQKLANTAPKIGGGKALLATAGPSVRDFFVW